jgi:uncharacterized protein with GYD domain
VKTKAKRRAAAEAALKSVGGRVEAFYFAFGEHDAYVIVDVPDLVTTTAAALTVNASGAVQVRTTVLITPEEVIKRPRRRSSIVRPDRHSPPEMDLAGKSLVVWLSPETIARHEEACPCRYSMKVPPRLPRENATAPSG